MLGTAKSNFYCSFKAVNNNNLINSNKHVKVDNFYLEGPNLFNHVMFWIISNVSLIFLILQSLLCNKNYCLKFKLLNGTSKQLGPSTGLS